MKKRMAGALGGVAALVATQPASADEGTGTLNAGYIFSGVLGRSGATANGVEATFVYYPDKALPFGFGPLAQWQSYGGDEGRWAAGGQFNLGPWGAELAYARRGSDGSHTATAGTHVATFVSAGIIHLALRTTIVPDPPPSSHGAEYAITLGIKLPLPIPSYPDVLPHLRIPSGRPLRVSEGTNVGANLAAAGGANLAGAGWARVASLSGGREWGAEVRPRLAGLGAADRAARAELLALGAPPGLVEATHRAALDEIRHARLCFALASAYAGGSLGAGELLLPPPRAPDLPELARESYLDGCIGEACAAAVARDELRDCEDPAIAAVLRVIARDEARHAKLAWQIVAWCLHAGGPEVGRVLDAARANQGGRRGEKGKGREGREARCYERVVRRAGRRLDPLLGPTKPRPTRAAPPDVTRAA
ncbi:MAG: ferritin-like domain-containing protein [Polyangiaceae bacterium]|nr:ferritin-like domain-containing protein [Polyangiaceae bacterium]